MLRTNFALLGSQPGIAFYGDEDDDDDEGEDFDLYDDENIVVTTFTTPATPRLHELGRLGGSGQGTTTTTSIRLTRKNDESIIWVSSSEDGDANVDAVAPSGRRGLFQYEMFY